MNNDDYPPSTLDKWEEMYNRLIEEERGDNETTMEKGNSNTD